MGCLLAPFALLWGFFWGLLVFLRNNWLLLLILAIFFLA